MITTQGIQHCLAGGEPARPFSAGKNVRFALGLCALSLAAAARADDAPTPPTADPAPAQVAALAPAKPKQYNLALLQGAGKTVDVKSLLGNNNALPGTYRSDIYINRSLSGRRDIELVMNPASGDVEPCLPLELLEQVGVDMAKLHSAAKPKAGPSLACHALPALIDQATATYDAQRLRLDLSVPQASMNRGQQGYVDPSAWDAGVPVAFVNYSLNNRYDRNRQFNTNYANLGLRNGLNVGGWRFRNDSNLNAGSQYTTSFASNNTYAQHDVTAIKSQFWAGDTFTNSPIYDSFRFRGMQLASDEGMRPDSERGYAPVVRGTAETNATVEIRQNNFLIYTANVSPGPFEITDLSPSGSNGDLEITIIEADGRRRVSRQAFSSPPLMVREGRLVHSAAIGQFRSNYARLKTPAFASGSLLYGLTDSLTVVGGFQSTQGYQAFTVGAGVNTRAGALSADATHTNSRVGDAANTGNGVRLLYGKFLEPTATNLSVSTSRYFSPGYRGLPEHVQDMSDSVSYSQARTRLDVSLTQQLGKNARYGSLYLSGSDQRYWNSGNSQSVTAGYSNNWRNVSYNLGVSYARNLETVHRNGDRSERQDSTIVSLTMSFPLGKSPTAPRAMVSASHQGNGGSSVQTGVYGNFSGDRDFAYSVQAGRDGNGGNSASAALNANTPVANLGGGVSAGPGQQSANFSAYGSVVAHAGGVNLGQQVGETFALVKVDPRVSGVKLDNYAGATTGHNGYAVLPYATPYRTNWVGLDTRELGGDVELDNALQQVVPRRGAAALVTFKGVTGRRVQFQLSSADGAPLPFGTLLESASGENLGISDPTGRALVLLQQERGALTMRWEKQQCQANYALPPKAKDENYLRVKLQCNAA
ncbi:fimbria/pilus outer membrane usher protein [Achromobacter sp. NPDC058515]|uniref:fimbria/pilus outer membrane usher protein n=1 Tax=Achromobacter sp. NPDC058515 TaxID=3346533 RepID=UPI00365C3201